MKKYNIALSFVRVIAMLSIILGHLCKAYKINDYQFGGIGVEIFLFLSGYLYSNRQLNDYAKWLVGRWKRLIFPLWCAIGIYLIISIAIGKNVEGNSLICYIFCIQGIKNIFFDISIPKLPGMGQTWFLTVIIVCYFLMIVLKKALFIENWINDNKIISLLITVALQIACCYVGIQLIYFIEFFIGYYFAKKDDETSHNLWVTKKNVSALMILGGFSGVIRLVSKKYIDGSILYDRIVARWSFCFIAILIVAILILLCRFSFIKELTGSGV